MHRQFHRDCSASVTARIDPNGRDVASEMTKRAGTAVSIRQSSQYLSDGLLTGDLVYPNSKQPDARIHVDQ
jgi:hypothetical protein